ITPGAACAADVSMPAIRACGWLLRSNATCKSRSGFRSAAYSPRPVNNRGSSVRLIGAPTFRGRRTSDGCARASLLIAIDTLAQRLPLPVVMAADHGGAGGLDPPHFRECLELLLDVPGIAGRGIG